jgi:hypothetical protein
MKQFRRVSPPVCLRISAPLPLDRFFVRFCTEVFLRNSVEKIHTLLKSGKNIEHFTWSVFQIVVSAMCNTTIQIRQCCVSMTRHSIFITLLTVTFVRHHYKGRRCSFSTQSGYANAPQYSRMLSTFLRFFFLSLNLLCSWPVCLWRNRLS